MATRYLVIAGIDYDGKRAEPGDVVDDIPSKAARWLLKGGYIEQASDVHERTGEATEKVGRQVRRAAGEAAKVAEGTDTTPEEVLSRAIEEQDPDETLSASVKDVAKEVK